MLQKLAKRTSRLSDISRQFIHLDVSTLERLAALAPTTLACMHGAAWRGDGGALLRALAGRLEGSRQPAADLAPVGAA